MEDITCPRHRILSRFADESGRPLCGKCFAEAREHAESEAFEAKVRVLRSMNEPSLTQSSAAWLLTRLGWGE